MIKTFCMLVLSFILTPAFAAKSCDELKGEIEAKMKGHGVASPSLEVLPKADVKDQKVVGSCDGGASRIIYKKG